MVFFHYDYGSRSMKTVTNLPGNYRGHLQSDGYKAYDVFNDNDQVLAEFALSQIQLLYRLEQKADQEKSPVRNVQ